jgi:hypothetical protein
VRRPHSVPTAARVMSHSIQGSASKRQSIGDEVLDANASLSGVQVHGSSELEERAALQIPTQNSAETEVSEDNSQNSASLKP